MAKKALIQKQQRKPKYKVRAYTRCRRCGRPRSVYRKFGLCRICLRELVHAGRGPRRDQGELVKGGADDDDDRSDRRHAHPHPQRQRGDARRGEDAVRRSRRWRWPRSSSRRATSTGFAVAPPPTGPGDVLTISMKYSPERARTISGLRRVSKPGLRVYSKADKVPRVLGGLGVAVLSTSQGLMTDREAASASVGGEVLCYVW